MMKIGFAASLVAVAVMAAFSAYGWTHIPADAIIARHWNTAGVADGFSPRDHVLIGGPLLAVALSAVFAAIPAIDPRRDNVRDSMALLIVGWVGSLALIVVAFASIVLAAASGESRGLPVSTAFYGTCLLLILIGNFTAKSRSNFFLGVRTPWTLSSEHAWSLANRTGGWLLVLVLVGAASAAIGMAYGTERGFPVLIAGAIAAGLFAVIVSYFAWRADPERKTG